RRLKKEYLIRKLTYANLRMALAASALGSLFGLGFGIHALVTGDTMIQSIRTRRSAEASIDGDALVFWMITSTYFLIGLVMAAVLIRIVWRYGPFITK